MRFVLPAFLFAAAPQESKAENDARFHPALLTAAKNHEAYTKGDDVARFAPALCKAPPPPPIRISGSKDESTHGRKLYHLYASNAEAYMKDGRREVRVKAETIPAYENKAAQQVLIKQSWACVEIGKADDTTPYDKTGAVKKDGKLFTRGEQRDLFIMIKFDEKAEGTDRGWVYGTVSPDGKNVTSSGRVRSCMDCHEKAGDGRLFGLPKPEKK